MVWCKNYHIPKNISKNEWWTSYQWLRIACPISKTISFNPCQASTAWPILPNVAPKCFYFRSLKLDCNYFTSCKEAKHNNFVCVDFVKLDCTGLNLNQVKTTTSQRTFKHRNHKNKFRVWPEAEQCFKRKVNVPRLMQALFCNSQIPLHSFPICTNAAPTQGLEWF